MGKNYRELAHQLIPGGAHTYSRGDDQYPQNAPNILERGEGCYVWDTDGNKYLDYGMALRAVTVGYDNRRISEAAIRQIHYGNNLTRASKIEIEAAQAMVDLIDGMDMVKFAKNGSSVTTGAVKLARAYTGRKFIARCAQHPFFSYDDWFIGSTALQRGIPEQISSLTLTFNFNDLNSLKALFTNYPDMIACVILEPATTAEPEEGFFEGLQELCKANGAVFILDEMITGFRWDLGGAQRYYNIKPDLCTFGKGMANGFSVAALMGKREIMELGGIQLPNEERVFLMSTTHGAEMSGLGALLETIQVYKELDVVGSLWKYGKRLMEGFNGLVKAAGISEQLYMEGVPVSPNYVCKNKTGEVSLDFRTLFSQEMIRNGVLMPWVALSYAHGDKEFDMTMEAANKAVKVYYDALNGSISDFLIGSAIKPVFRKFN